MFTPNGISPSSDNKYICTFYDEKSDDISIEGFNARLNGKDFTKDIKATRKSKINKLWT